MSVDAFRALMQALCLLYYIGLSFGINWNFGRKGLKYRNSSDIAWTTRRISFWNAIMMALVEFWLQVVFRHRGPRLAFTLWYFSWGSISSYGVPYSSRDVKSWGFHLVLKYYMMSCTYPLGGFAYAAWNSLTEPISVPLVALTSWTYASCEIAGPLIGG